MRPLMVLGVVLASGLGVAQAATTIRQESAPLRWQSVPMDGSEPQTTLLGAGSGPGPSSTLIPLAAAGSNPRSDEALAETALPADAQVAAARIRPPHLIRPSLGGGVPTGFVSGLGDYFVSGSAGTPGNLRDGSPDGSINLGFGVGDPERFVGAEVYWGIGSIKNLNANGAFGASLGRLLVNRPDLQVSVAGGVIDAYSYGSEANPPPLNGYGAVSASLPLRSSDPVFPQLVQFTIGGGGSSFGAINDSFETTQNGLFGAVGVELSPALGVSVGASSRSTNVNVSWIPFRTLPIFVNALAADVFSATPWGTIGVLTVGWGDNLRTGFVSR